MAGVLYIVATPIGNLEDMTYRAVRILQEVDLIAAEDTRHTRKLLSHFKISTPLISYYREKEAQRTTELIEKMTGGLSIALVSDAGTPGISDPGALLVNQVRAAGLRIIPIPGPSALSAALSCAGLEPGTFLFLGFAPGKGSQRRKLLQSLAASPYPLVFYEAPHRVHRFIADALEILGERTLFWARELTKKFEEIERISLTELAGRIAEAKIRGELVLIIEPGSHEVVQGENVDEILQWYHDQGILTMKDACRQVASDMGIGRSEVYRRALAIWNR